VPSFEYVKDKIRAGERLSFDEGVFLYQKGPLLDLSILQLSPTGDRIFSKRNI